MTTIGPSGPNTAAVSNVPSTSPPAETISEEAKILAIEHQNVSAEALAVEGRRQGVEQAINRLKVIRSDMTAHGRPLSMSELQALMLETNGIDASFNFMASAQRVDSGTGAHREEV